MTSKSLYNNGRSVLKREAAELAEQAEKYQAAVVAANRERLRMDAPAVDPTLLQDAQAVFVRGSGWRFVRSVNRVSVTVWLPSMFSNQRVPLDQIVDFR